MAAVLAAARGDISGSAVNGQARSERFRVQGAFPPLADIAKVVVVCDTVNGATSYDRSDRAGDQRAFAAVSSSSPLSSSPRPPSSVPVTCL